MKKKAAFGNLLPYPIGILVYSQGWMSQGDYLHKQIYWSPGDNICHLNFYTPYGMIHMVVDAQMAEEKYLVSHDHCFHQDGCCKCVTEQEYWRARHG